MDIIRLLPDNVANQIAAGEVVQRPSSVVKELLENAVDAGADKIELWFTDAGKTSIQVIDNGKGMSETDARMAFERHATSKITTAADLYNLHTKGFRGEALASIAAVAQVELKTRTIDDEIGIQLSIQGSRLMEQHPVACPRGAQFTVNNLFYNVPARRRFLKADVTESKNIIQEFERVALIHHDIDFSLHKDGTLVTDLRQGSFKKRIADMFGASIDKELLPIHVDTSLVKIEGFVGTPQSAKQRGMRQFFFVNDRYMRHPYFHKAVQMAFERLIPADRQVSYFYSLTVDPSHIDVNIHPTKTEIKFEDEQAVWQIILAATREALGTFNAVPVLNFDPAATPNIPTYSSSGILPEQPKVQVDKNYNPFRAISEQRIPANQRNWQMLYPDTDRRMDSSRKGDVSGMPKNDSFQNFDVVDGQKTTDEENVFLQYGQYIFTQSSAGLMMIDQRAAHVRVLYDGYMQNMEGQPGISQGLLFPELFHLNSSLVPVLNKLLPDLKRVGFDITSAGSGGFAINGVPSGMEKKNPVDIIMMLLEHYRESGVASEAVHSTIALHLAKQNAISASQHLDTTEMSHLVSQLLQCKSPKYTPSGKMVITILSIDQLSAFMR